MSVEQAYELAYEAHWLAVVRFAVAWTNDWAAAEDVTADAFVRLWTHRSRVDWDRPILPWLLVAARRLASNRLRSLRRRALGSSAPQAPDAALIDRWLDVQAAMSVLSPLERSALVLTTVHGLPYAEAAEILGSSASALRAAVSRARAKLEEA